jgi:hypothetical protein
LNRVACIYHYFEKNYKYKENLIFFLNTAIVNEIEYFIYISGICSVKLPKIPNIHYIHIKNENHDFAALIEFYKKNFFLNYDIFIFINSSVRGPFVPNYISLKWYELFTSKLSKKVALVGSSICTLPLDSKNSIDFEKEYNFNPPYFHIQTTAYAISSAGYKILLNKGFFELNKKLKKKK